MLESNETKRNPMESWNLRESLGILQNLEVLSLKALRCTTVAEKSTEIYQQLIEYSNQGSARSFSSSDLRNCSKRFVIGTDLCKTFVSFFENCTYRYRNVFSAFENAFPKTEQYFFVTESIIPKTGKIFSHSSVRETELFEQTSSSDPNQN